MRNLTIHRIKSFVGCLAKLKVYIEDPSCNEMIINGIPCRKIGELKNGEEKTFCIDEQAARVFVIADKYSKGFCNEYYHLPAGQEDILLTGKNKFNLATGNAFLFYNNQNAEALRNRKHNAAKGTAVLMAAIIVGLVIGNWFSIGFFGMDTSKPKTFSSDGITMTLTDAFSEIDAENFTVSYASKEVVVLTLKESFSSLEGLQDYSLKEYTDLMIQNNQLDTTQPISTDDTICFEYDNTSSETNETYRYFCYIYKADDAFWVVQFGVPVKEATNCEPEIREWAKSIQFID